MPADVIGVMPEGFKFPLNTDLWHAAVQITDLDDQKRNSRPLQVFGRLAPGVTREQAQSELINIAQRLESDNPDTNKDIQPQVQTFNESRTADRSARSSCR